LVISISLFHFASRPCGVPFEFRCAARIFKNDSCIPSVGMLPGLPSHLPVSPFAIARIRELALPASASGKQFGVGLYA